MKHNILKTSLWILALLTFVLVLPRNSLAAEQSKIVTYDINDSGTANITYEISLQNKDQHSYISKYTLSTGLRSIGNISARLTTGQTLTYRMFDDKDTKSIEVTFPQPSRPQDSVNWVLSYSSTEPVTTVGNIREISVPGFVGDMALTVIIKVPQSFGSANYFSSQPAEETIDESKRVFKFTDPRIKDSGVLISVGEEQFYQFTYKYELENNENIRMRATVALPPDYKNQKIFFEKVEPTPADGYRDADGNYIAEYLVDPGEKYGVLIEGKAKIKNALSNDFRSPNLNPENYLGQDVYWEVNNNEILSLALKLTEGKESNYEKAKAIYDYVSTELSYNHDALDNTNRQRLGAYVVLGEKENAICQEYSDLFVTLSRAAGVPARLLAGYTTAGIGYDLPQNTLHAWAEFYDEKEGWVTVDPTWESTSNGFNFFDNVGINHFILSIRGVSSTEPPLVLSFTPTDDISDNLIIEPISASSEENVGEVEFTVSFPETVSTGIQNYGTAIITNNTNHVISGYRLLASGELVTIVVPEFDETKAIFPGEQKSINFSILPKSLFKSDSDTVKIALTGTLGEDERINFSESDRFDIEVNKIIAYGFIFLAVVASGVVVIGGRAVVKKVQAKRK